MTTMMMMMMVMIVMMMMIIITTNYILSDHINIVEKIISFGTFIVP